MNLPQWTASPECAARTLCVYCRDTSERGKTFRASLVRSGWPLPADAPDFACPHGVEWNAGTTPADTAERELIAAAANPEGWGDHVAALIHKVGADRVYQLVRTGVGLPADCGGCNARRKALNRLGEWAKGVLG